MERIPHYHPLTPRQAVAYAREGCRNLQYRPPKPC